jgi:glutaminyl-peptide cyclotransferase
MTRGGIARWHVGALAMCAAIVSVPAAGQRRIPPAATASMPVHGYQIVHTYPHDPQAFTQGLVYHNGFLYEGTGLNGRSSIRKVRLENGEVVQIQKIDAMYFGEGIVIWQNSLIQLTWQSEVGFEYDLATFERKRTFTYRGEGWGLTHDGKRLIMSDGQKDGTLRYLDPVTLKEIGRLPVRDGNKPVENLNELEFVKGEILANIWGTTRIARISPATGQVTGWLEMRNLLTPREAAAADVLNGIAYDAAGDRLFVTGKLWPKLFEIRIEPQKNTDKHR